MLQTNSYHQRVSVFVTTPSILQGLGNVQPTAILNSANQSR
jgi:hypothetical protein